MGMLSLVELKRFFDVQMFALICVACFQYAINNVSDGVSLTLFYAVLALALLVGLVIKLFNLVETHRYWVKLNASYIFVSLVLGILLIVS